LDAWLRTAFVEHNTALEEAYFAAGVEFLAEPALEPRKQAILHEGAAHAGALDALPERVSDRYELLGMVGFVLGACRRHEVDDPAVLAPVWRVAQRVADSIGVAPRYVFAHQAFFNSAREDRFRTFTALEDEATFVELNALGVLAYDRAAAALRRIPPMGVSNPMAGHLLDVARTALEEVLAFNQRIAREVSVERFFRNIRPYFKPYRVGAAVQRGANAGDFSAINEIDVLLGLCDVEDPFYAGIVAEKIPFVPPDQQAALRTLAADGTLLERFEAEAEAGVTPGLRDNAERFLAVCRAHGAVYSYHHHALVKPFLERPAAATPPGRYAGLSASGPPLGEVIAMLERLRALRTARAPLQRLRELIA
jgi:monodechloroaminopyrrolnitrin synthase PrnB-like protein